ncbi:hypothetical protein GWC95_07820 [Sediminibacterium roseum]|uniref:Uncharacterized protein n=1 Tax=Sediminibacterium roseum TaxID=1978412 RepID=A0ABW9ZS97_9BACT|nr:hypothetical protein [Sediminibacterium roseum]NCI49824.1 hypothetical protein [Sediminibacterium roseum]
MPFLDYKPIALEKFSFLVTDYGFELTEVRSENYGTFLIYGNKEKKIVLNLGYEYRDQMFYYFLNDGIKRLTFHDFFGKYDPSLLYWPDLMPKGDDFLPALEKNIALLKKYGHNFLSGKEKL